MTTSWPANQARRRRDVNNRDTRSQRLARGEHHARALQMNANNLKTEGQRSPYRIQSSECKNAQIPGISKAGPHRCSEPKRGLISLDLTDALNKQMQPGDEELTFLAFSYPCPPTRVCLQFSTTGAQVVPYTLLLQWVQTAKPSSRRKLGQNALGGKR